MIEYSRYSLDDYVNLFIRYDPALDIGYHNGSPIAGRYFDKRMDIGKVPARYDPPPQHPYMSDWLYSYPLNGRYIIDMDF